MQILVQPPLEGADFIAERTFFVPVYVEFYVPRFPGVGARAKTRKIRYHLRLEHWLKATVPEKYVRHCGCWKPNGRQTTPIIVLIIHMIQWLFALYIVRPKKPFYPIQCGSNGSSTTVNAMDAVDPNRPWFQDLLQEASSCPLLVVPTGLVYFPV